MDFWRMVVECEVQVIVMACNEQVIIVAYLKKVDIINIFLSLLNEV